MSQFSDALKAEIKKSAKTLPYLSEASGLSIDHISKMRSGARVSHSEQKVAALIDALQLPQERAEKLLYYYKIDLIGTDHWNCFCEFISLLNEDFSIQQEFKDVILEEQVALPDISILSNKRELLFYINKLTHYAAQHNQNIRILTKNSGSFLFRELISILVPTDIRIEHIFPLMQNTAPDHVLYNLRLLHQIMPLIQSNTQYEPCYYYESSTDLTEFTNAFMDLYSTWIITDSHAVAVNTQLNCGIVLSDEAMIRQLSFLFGKKKAQTKPFAVWHEDPMVILNQIQDGLQSDSRGCSFYTEYAPCFQYVLSEEAAARHILPEFRTKPILENYLSWLKRYTQFSIFGCNSTDGIRYFLETGRLFSIPSFLYSPLEPKERLEMAKAYVSFVKTHRSGIHFHLLDDAKLMLSNICLYSNSVIGNLIVIFSDDKMPCCCTISEAGIAEELDKFVTYFKGSDYILSEEKSLEILQKIIKEYEQRFTADE